MSYSISKFQLLFKGAFLNMSTVLICSSNIGHEVLCAHTPGLNLGSYDRDKQVIGISAELKG